MGEPGALCGAPPAGEHIARRGQTQGSETSQYLKEEKSTEIARVAASESAGAQTGRLAVRGRGTGTWNGEGQGNRLESLATGGESPVPEVRSRPTGIPSRAEHVKLRPNPGGPPSKAKHYLMTDSEQVP